MEKQNWDHDLMENILSLIQFFQEHGGSVHRPGDVLALLPDVPELQATYEMIRFMEEIPGGFMIYRASGGEEIVYVNRGLLRIFQCDDWEQFRELTGGSFRGLVHPEDLEEVEESIVRQVADSQYDLDYVEYRVICRDGTISWIEHYGHFVHSKAVGDFFYVFLGDATQKRNQRMDEEFRREQKQKRILAEALENANLAIVAKNDFLSNMSHNMRTPLNAIFGFTALAKLKTQDPELLDYLERIDTSGRQLLDLIEKALEISWISTGGKGVEEECDLCQMTRSVCGAFLAQAENKRLSFTLDCVKVKDSLVQSDREGLQQLVGNLVSNAVTYTRPGGRVSVRLTEEDSQIKDRRSYCLTVEDTGVGIGEEFLDRIFEPFAREKDTTHSGVNGMGLGLTIAKYIVDRMGGTIKVDSTLGEGSTFTVVLQLRPCDPEDRGAEAQLAGQGAFQHILLVEDNDINREIEMELLKNGGFAVDTAENGAVAVEKVRSSAPKGYDLILMDIQMPVMDGWQAAREIRALEDPVLSEIPIVALSANTLVGDMRRSLECGMDAHMTKPIDVPRFIDEVRRAARKRKKQLTSGENMIK